MADIREAILQRIQTIMESIAPGRVFRNIDDISGRSGLSIALHDGDEAVSDDFSLPVNSRGDPRIVKDYMSMTPSVLLILGGTSATVGSDMNANRALIIPLVIGDNTLAGYVGSNGKLRYTGASFDVQAGERREARMTLDFRFTYPIDVLHLT